MASKAIANKRKGLASDSSAKGSPHAVLIRKMKSSTSAKTGYEVEKNAISLNLARSPKFIKVNPDKENNNVSSLAPSCKVATPKYSRMPNSVSTCTPKSNAKTTVESSFSKSTTPVCAASMLSNSTSALARRHRKSHVSTDQQNSPKNQHENSTMRKSAKKIPHEKDTPGNMSPYHGTPPKRRPIIDSSSSATASPTLKSIPSDMVKKMVKNIQDKPPISPGDNGVIRSPRNVRSPSNVRKNLSKRLSSCNRRTSSVANLGNETIPEDFSVTVAVRVRPFSQREKDNGAKQVVFMRENETLISHVAIKHNFSYDFSFDSIENNSAFASQTVVYEKLARPLLSSAFNGYNTCLFAYGQTGSGKSYTIMGNSEDTGVIPRFCDGMFAGVRSITSKDKTAQFRIEMSYFEIYNEKIHDLLVSNQQLGADGERKKQVLKVREHPEEGPYIEGLSKFVVTSFDDIQSWLDVGNQQRVTASTGMNDKSSRSHSVFILNMTRTTVEMLEGERHESSRRSRINLVDLAGSERSSTAQTSGQRLKEGASINKSLLTLGKVIFALSERSKVTSRRQSRLFIPYRDSALTWLLKESLGGNSRTAMIATVSPADIHIEETLSTLRYAAQARTIVNAVRINEDPNAAIIRELKSEIAKLRAAHQSPSVNLEEYRTTMHEVAQLREKLTEAENDKEEANTKWRKKLEESERRKAEEINELKRAGVSFKVDNRLPNLVNLNEDPQLSELLLYVIKHGTTRIGRRGGPHECEIQLAGALIADLHCEITNRNEVVTISPKDENAKIFINGDMIQKMTTLHHGDRIVIAGDHFFRLNHPIEVQRKKKFVGNRKEEKKDFEFAKNEFHAAQSARMEAEIEQTRIKVKQEMMREMEHAKQEAQIKITEQKEQYEKVVNSLQTQLEKDQCTKKQLEDVREENLVLQKEVDANRRRQEMEARILAQKTVIDERDLVTSHIFAELEAERLKLASDIERMENNLKKRKKQKNSVNDAPCGQWTPLKVSILLEEANKISKSLNANTLFSRHEVDNGSVQIKVENTKLKIWTLWSMEKFDEKLEAMREAFDVSSKSKTSSGNNGNGYSDTDDNLFYDPADTWWEVFDTGKLLQSRDRLGATGETSTTTKPRQSRRVTRRLSSLTVARTSPALQQSLLQFDRQFSQNRNDSDEPSVLSLCKSILTSVTKDQSDSVESPVDVLLETLHQLSNWVDSISDEFDSHQGVNSSSEQLDEILIKATVDAMNLDKCISYIRHHCSETKDVHCMKKSSSKLFQKLTESGKKLTGEMAKLLQGFDGEIEQIVKESSSNIRVLIPNISKYAGALTLAMKITTSVLDDHKEHLLSYRIKNAFIQGADSFLRKTITEGLSSLQNAGCLNKSESTDGKLLLQSGVELLQSCRDLQQRLCDSSLIIREAELPPQYYQQYMERVREITEVISKMIAALCQVDVECSKSSPEFDIKIYEKILRDCAINIALLSSPPDDTLMEGNLQNKNLNWNSNNSNNNTSSYEEETERMYNAVQDTAEDFIHTLTTVCKSSDCLKTGQGTKDLSESLINGTCTPSFHTTSVSSKQNINVSCSTAISNSVKKWLELTDHMNQVQYNV